jgi:hypothetical protein
LEVDVEGADVECSCKPMKKKYIKKIYKKKREKKWKGKGVLVGDSVVFKWVLGIRKVNYTSCPANKPRKKILQVEEFGQDILFILYSYFDITLYLYLPLLLSFLKVPLLFHPSFLRCVVFIHSQSPSPRKSTSRR